MNYPAYVGEDFPDDSYAAFHPGLGYKYSSDQVFKSLPEPIPTTYGDFLGRYDSLESANMKMKAAMTDLAFTITRRVWKDLPVSVDDRGSCFFCVGGINSINPFSATAVKNEIAVYSEQVVDEELPRLNSTISGMTYDMSAKECNVNLMDYTEIYLDFNGSMAFLNEEWIERLGLAAAANRVKGVFVMGGVRSDSKPMTMPSIPNVLNRFSSATMNQLYHPQNTGEFFKLFAENPSVPVFTVTNNVVEDLATFGLHADGSKYKTREGIDLFLKNNSICGDFIQKLAYAHYEGRHNPPRKAFDYYTAAALTHYLSSMDATEGKSVGCSKMMAERRVRRLFYSDEYGLTFVSVDYTWDSTLERYISNIDTVVDPTDVPFIRTKKEYFLKEINVMKTIPLLQSLKVYDLSFQLDANTKKLSLDFETCSCACCAARLHDSD